MHLFPLVLVAILSTASSSSRGGSSSTRTYDKQVNVFNAEGDLPQLAYADIAASRGDSLICIATEDNCLVLCTPTGSRAALQDRRVIDKISKLDEGLWAAFAGLAGDGRALVRTSRKLSANYRLSYNAPPTLRFLAKSIADINHEATLTGGERPYGVNLLMLGYEPGAEVPQVFLSKASGHLSQWRAVAIGKNSDRAMAHLETCLVSSAKDKLVKKPESVMQAAEMALDIFRQENMQTSFGSSRRESDRDKDEGPEPVASVAAGENPEALCKCDLYLLRRNLEGIPVLTMAAGVTSSADLDGSWKIVPRLNKVLEVAGGFCAAVADGAVSGGSSSRSSGGKKRRALRAIANRLKTQSTLAVVTCGSIPISPAFVDNFKAVLAARSLVQVKFSVPDKKECKALSAELAAQTGADVVQIMGHTGLFFLPGRGEVSSEVDKLLVKELA